jgi:uncharacterized protein YunC (DUF1805 family)
LELLYPRSRLVTAAKAHGLQAIDLVSSHKLHSFAQCLLLGIDTGDKLVKRLEENAQ